MMLQISEYETHNFAYMQIAFWSQFALLQNRRERKKHASASPKIISGLPNESTCGILIKMQTGRCDVDTSSISGTALLRSQQTQQTLSTTMMKQAADQQSKMANLLAQNVQQAPQPVAASDSNYSFSTYAWYKHRRKTGTARWKTHRAVPVSTTLRHVVESRMYHGSRDVRQPQFAIFTLTIASPPVINLGYIFLVRLRRLHKQMLLPRNVERRQCGYQVLSD